MELRLIWLCRSEAGGTRPQSSSPTCAAQCWFQPSMLPGESSSVWLCAPLRLEAAV